MFVQLIQFETTRFDEGKALNEEYVAKTRGRSTIRRSLVAKDRDHPNRYVAMVEFDSYEDAEQNSEMPETQAFSKAMADLTDGGPTFVNLDVIDVREQEST